MMHYAYLRKIKLLNSQHQHTENAENKMNEH